MRDDARGAAALHFIAPDKGQPQQARGLGHISVRGIHSDSCLLVYPPDEG